MKTLTSGPPPKPVPVMISSKSVAIDVARRDVHAAGEGDFVGHEAEDFLERDSVEDSTCGPPPAPAAVMMSGIESLLMKPIATRTPPVNWAP